MLNKYVFIIQVIILIFTLVGCNDEKVKTVNINSNKPIVRINDYTITTSEFSKQILNSPYVESIEDLSYQEKINFTNNLIEKEILIKEAISQGLDKDESFRFAIEKYWEQTLITNLLKKKMKSIDKEIIITNEEINLQFVKLKKETNNVPKEELIKEISNNLLSKKKSRAISEWIAMLKAKSKITIYEKNIKNIR